jgi:hypothetical protein
MGYNNSTKCFIASYELLPQHRTVTLLVEVDSGSVGWFQGRLIMGNILWARLSGLVDPIPNGSLVEH